MGLRSNKADLKTLKNSFNQIDTDHDGSLSKEELEKADHFIEMIIERNNKKVISYKKIV